ncbi:hypothetical protein POSPLADRAFT_1133013 [Postia placenta MAD-698-R-SB12]|uniref:Uncharacterized protein n=1 Tax=Postia placenta MAD-698-R-SB12 TaxID=670580 RepID=A0A1X6NDR1_9APHY|nr:hypothetical protein POSPLADRAFT_1133013 [Postia placenta MAD-698-R-SB12]OSX66768.1 hypothetical protein POSPLADRAFT_1133013 [Postia placenta MAD-698-R-SB12]
MHHHHLELPPLLGPLYLLLQPPPWLSLQCRQHVLSLPASHLFDSFYFCDPLRTLVPWCKTIKQLCIVLYYPCSSVTHRYSVGPFLVRVHLYVPLWSHTPTSKAQVSQKLRPVQNVCIREACPHKRYLLESHLQLFPSIVWHYASGTHMRGPKAFSCALSCAPSCVFSTLALCALSLRLSLQPFLHLSSGLSYTFPMALPTAFLTAFPTPFLQPFLWPSLWPFLGFSLAESPT